MKLINRFQQQTIPFLNPSKARELIDRFFWPAVILAGMTAAIWLLGPHLSWKNTFPLAKADKRFYLIAGITLVWVLKFLWSDLGKPSPQHHTDPIVQRKLNDLHARFMGALKFLTKTRVTRQGRSLKLLELPGFLLLGPVDAGKTTLLANADIRYILHRQFKQEDLKNLPPSENCNWWVTREVSIIDVPGKYIFSNIAVKTVQQSIKLYPILWRCFLSLLKKHHNKHGLNGIILALPFPELMKQPETKNYQAMLTDLFLRLNELQKTFGQSIPCQLVITKCDLLPGFSEYFSESSNEEVSQAWGITMPEVTDGEKRISLFTQRFDALIRKLNQQLLWRMHQERNPSSRPYIKDFPLQVERLKEFTIEFIKRFNATQLSIPLQGVFLTSAVQKRAGETGQVIEQSLNHQQRGLQVFRAPEQTARPYFIKQFLTHGLVSAHAPITRPTSMRRWHSPAAYAASIAVVLATTLLLGRDFHHGIKQTYKVQNSIADYQHTLLQIQDPNEHLVKTVALLNSLHQTQKAKGFKLDLSHLLYFYSNKSQDKMSQAYQTSLQVILLPQIKNYLGDYLKNPINKNTGMLYGVLKAYLMMGDAEHMNPEYVIAAIREIIPPAIPANTVDELDYHLANALQTIWQPLPLDQGIIEETRRYFAGLPSLQMSYILLKNMNDNNKRSDLDLGMNAANAIFVSQPVINQVPNMFIARNFPTITSQEIGLAAQEATIGNWILSTQFATYRTPGLVEAPLVDQLRTTYVNDYVEVWERVISNIHLNNPKSLNETDTMITYLIGNNSPLLQLLQTLHDNTYFEPVSTTSPRLQTIGQLVEKTPEAQNQLFQIFAALKSLHEYLQPVLKAPNPKKGAADLVSDRMQHSGTPDPITQLRLVAQNTPEPLKGWLANLADNSWRLLVADAGHYLDVSWRDEVGHAYASTIANRYPFDAKASQEVELQKFAAFFGNPGILMNFYNQHLKALVDTTGAEWRWKSMDDLPLPFAPESIRQIQQAMKINHAFFPNGDNKLSIQFAFQPYKLSDHIQRVQFTLNDKEFTDDHTTNNNPHVIGWPGNQPYKMTSIKLTMMNKQSMKRNFPGEWGIFKLMNQSMESMVNKKGVVINLSMDERPVKYILFTEGAFNPLFADSLHHFQLPLQLQA